MAENTPAVPATNPENKTSVNGTAHYTDIRRKVAEKMAGEVTLSDNPGETLKKWRVNFDISQSDLAGFLKVSPSVISDYESGRRKSPGIFIVSRIIDAILEIDISRGGQKIKSYEGILPGGFNSDIIFDIHEYLSPITLDELISAIKGDLVYKPPDLEKLLYGYTVMDSLRAIIELSPNEFQKLYGWSTERAMVFTKVSTGRSPLVAIRVTNLKPGAVVVHGLKATEVDPIAKKIAEIEYVPLISTTMPIDELIRSLQSFDIRR